VAGNSQAVFRVEPWSGSTNPPVDRALAEAASPGLAPRNAESWSSALGRDERTHARVDIRGSKPSERATPRWAVRLAAGLVACVALVVAAAPVARGDPGGSNGNAASNSASSSPPSQAATSDPATPSQADAPDSTAATDRSAPTTTGQSVEADAQAGQTGAKNDNSAVRDGQNGQNGPVGQGNIASASATSNGNANANGNGNGNGNTNGNDNGNANGNGNGNGSGNGNSNGHASATSAQDTPTNTNVAVRVGSPGDVGTIDQSNAAQSGATAGGTGSTDTSPDTTGNGGSSTAAADASQTAPANTNVDVRVGSSGDSGPVAQTNTSQANAGAGSAGAGSASATSSQTSPTNLNVTIRVGSPGDNAAAHQSNSVEATAGPPNAPHDSPYDASQPTVPAETDQTVTTSGSAEVTNASDLDQTIEQAGDSDPSAQQTGISSEPAANASTALVGSANATQTDALNLNLSIRIGSRGTDGSVTQENGAKAVGTSADLGLVTVTGGRNTTVTLVIPGVASAAPTNGPWTWNWVWNGDWTIPQGATTADVAATADALWTWVWQNPSSQTAAAPAATAATTVPVQQPGGTWTWTWTWKLPNGQIWSGGWQQHCDCNWTWNWNWDWSMGAPKSTPEQTTADSLATDPTSAPTGSDIGPVSQQNTATATATASAMTTVTQTLDQSQIGGDEDQVVSADQTLLHGQDAIAAAEADQTDAWNLSLIRGIATGPVSQTNEVTADALASASESIVQSTVQHQIGNDTTEQSATAGQVLAGSQSALAAALAGQTDARNMVFVSGPSTNGWVSSVEQRNSASTSATAVVSATLEQSIAQYQIAGSSLEQGADAAQTLDNAQSAHTAAVVGQTSTWNLAEIVVPVSSQATNPTLRQQNLVNATASTSDSSDVVQRILQSQDGIADIELASAAQDGAVGQQALAFAPAQQISLLNRSGWLGVEPTVSPPAPPAVAPPELPSPPASTAAAPVLPDGASVSLITGGFLLARIAPNAPLTVPWQRQLPSLGAPTLGGPGHAATGVAVTAIESGVPSGTESQSVLSSATGGNPGGTSSPRQDGGSGAGDAGVVLLLAPGAAGPAPHGGAGAIGLVGRAFRFVAPAHLGPQSPAPTLGRSVAFSEPIERPG
jgi:hypothetical protein